jgi:hypothetical protein
MHAADQAYDRPASTGLLTELVLPVYLAAWTRASTENDRIRPRVTARDETASDEDGDEGFLERPVAERRRRLASVAPGTVASRTVRRGSTGRCPARRFNRVGCIPSPTTIPHLVDSTPDW